MQHEISRRGTKSARKSSENFRELNENENIVIRTLKEIGHLSRTQFMPFRVNEEAQKSKRKTIQKIKKSQFGVIVGAGGNNVNPQ